MTPVQIQELINLNLADASNITPAKHREVETALLDYIKSILPLTKGFIAIGDITGSDELFTVNIPDVGTVNYYVSGSFKSLSANHDADNDVAWTWRETTATSFKISIREISSNLQNLVFYYEIKAI